MPPRSASRSAAPGFLLLNAPASAQIVEYLQRTLPAAAYQIDFQTLGTFTFSGKGWVGQVIGSENDTVITFSQLSSSDTTDSTSAPSAATAAPSAATAADPEALSPLDLNVNHTPFFFRFPPDTTLADLRDPPTGASGTFVAPLPVVVLAYYRALLSNVHFTVTDEQTAGGATTITFADDDGWTGTITVSPDTSTFALHGTP